jgi:acetyl-CoA carboxylase biotin carboxyl carrier protein
MPMWTHRRYEFSTGVVLMNDESIIKLIDKFGGSNVAELDIEEGSLHIVLRKESAIRQPAVTVPGQATAVSVPAVSEPGAYQGDGSAGAVHLALPVNAPAVIAASSGEAITSPIVATFYASAGPDAPAFVTAGSKVKAGDTLCILEAMKMMNHLEAEFNCEILSVKAASGDLVEYGQTLFEVKRI